MHDQTPVTITELYPEFSKNELEQAEANLRRYLAVLLRMAERMRAEGHAITDLIRKQPLHRPGSIEADAE